MKSEKLQFKIKNFFKISWPVFLIIIVWFVFASPYFLKGLVPYSSTYQVNFFPPWSHYEKFHGPVKNNAMPDVHTQIYPWKKLTIDTYKNGEIPLWNPYSFSGNPHLANFQTAVLSPFNMLFFIFSFIDAWSILILLQPLLAGVFMYLLLMEYRLRKEAGFLGAVAFMFCGFIVVWMAYGTLSYAILYLPLSLFFIERFLYAGEKIYLPLFSLTIPLTLYSGHFQTSLYLLLFVSAYLLWTIFREKKLKETILVLLFFVLGIVISLPQLLPTIEFYQHSVRSEAYITGGGVPIHYLITMLAPDFFGNPVTRNDWFGFYAEWASFVGIIPLFFALLAVIFRKNKHVFFFTLSTLVVLLLSVDSPVQMLLGSLKIPVISTSNPTRIIVLYSFAISVLAGFGLHSFLEKEHKKTNIVFPVFILGIVLLTTWAVLLVGNPFSLEKIAIAKRNLLLPSGLFAAVFLISIGRKFVSPRAFSGVVMVLLFLAAFDSLRFAQKWIPFESKALVYLDVPVITAIKNHIGYGRMFGNFGGETAVYYGISSIEGYDPLYIGRYGEFLRASEDGSLHEAERSVAKISRTGKNTDKIIDLLGVNTVFHPRADTNQSWAYPVWKNDNRFKLLYQDDKFELYRNTEALERVEVFYDFVIETDKQKILKTIFSDSFDTRKTLVLEVDPKVKQIESATGSATIVSYSPTRVVIEVESSDEGLVFLSDNYYPGWKATVGDAEGMIYRANYSFRAVKVPAGKSTIEFTYSY